MKMTTNLAWRAVVAMAMALGQSGCDAVYFRRIEVKGPATTSSPIDGPSTQVLVSALRAYAVDSKLSCPDSSQFPFECDRAPIRVWALSAAQGITVCYLAMGTAFERGKFKWRIKHLEEMLVDRFGTASVTSVPEMCR